MNHAVSVALDAYIASQRLVAAAESQKVHDDDAMPVGHQGYDIAPNVRRGRKAVEKNEWLTGSSRTGGVVIQSRAAEVDKLTAHQSGEWGTGGGEWLQECVRLQPWSRERSRLC